MNYVFFGTPEFAAIILEKLVQADMKPSLVVTNPDKPAGRKQVLTSPAVKDVAEQYGISVVQPLRLEITKNPAFDRALVGFRNGPKKPGSSLKESITNQTEKSTPVDNHKGRGPAGNRTPETQVTTLISDHPGPTTDLLYQDWDFFLVVAYGKIIPKSILEIPRLGVLNVHPSLLPKYRGPTPIQTAILNGDGETGVSIMLLDEKIDHGAILAQQKLEIVPPQRDPASGGRNWKLEIAQAELARLGAEMLIDVLPKYVAGEIAPVAQDHAKATFTKKFTTLDAEVSIQDLRDALEGDSQKAEKIDRMARALNPEPGVWTRTDDSPPSGLPKNKRVKILEVFVRGGTLKLAKIQVEGKEARKI